MKSPIREVTKGQGRQCGVFSAMVVVPCVGATQAFGRLAGRDKERETSLIVALGPVCERGWSHFGHNTALEPSLEQSARVPPIPDTDAFVRSSVLLVLCADIHR